MHFQELSGQPYILKRGYQIVKTIGLTGKFPEFLEMLLSSALTLSDIYASAAMVCKIQAQHSGRQAGILSFVRY